MLQMQALNFVDPIAAFLALDMDFTTGGTSGNIASSGGVNGTVFNALGYVISQAAPRINYDPVTLACKGLLIEKASTNICLYSSQLTQAGVYGDFSAGTTTATINYNNGPDNTLSAERLVGNNANTWWGQVVGSALNSKTFSETVFAKSNVGGTPNVGIASSVAAGTSGQGSQNLSSVYQRLSRTFTTAAGDTGNLIIALNHKLSNDVSAWGFQCEESAYPTSYIPTVASAVTRTADVHIMTGAAFTSWYKSGGTTLTLEADSVANGACVIWQADDNTQNNRITVWCSGTSVILDIVTGGVSQVGLNLGTVTPNTPFKVAVRLNTNDVEASLNGAVTLTDTSVTLPTVDRCRIGCDAIGQYLNGHFRKSRFYRNPYATSDLRALAA